MIRTRFDAVLWSTELCFYVEISLPLVLFLVDTIYRQSEKLVLFISNKNQLAFILSLQTVVES